MVKLDNKNQIFYVITIRRNPGLRAAAGTSGPGGRDREDPASERRGSRRRRFQKRGDAGDFREDKRDRPLHAFSPSPEQRQRRFHEDGLPLSSGKRKGPSGRCDRGRGRPASPG